MTIEYDEGKWWWTAGDGYEPRLIYLESDAFELIEKNNLKCTNDTDNYKCYEKL